MEEILWFWAEDQAGVRSPLIYNKGCSVTIVEQLPRIGSQIEAATKKMIIKGLKENRVKILTEHTLKEITDDRVYVADKNNNQFSIEFDKLVVSTGNIPDNKLYNDLKNKRH
jgi:pyruvate/2-oxoglutarate dehydrogenase complex dihydrolipoamide dehydrogenase (E3) component